jgi:succinylglutamic semialdehyde dehydrogenase
MSVLQSFNPANGELLWSGHMASTEQVHSAIAQANSAFASWSRTSLEERIALLTRYAELLTANKDHIADSISRETGKPRWETAMEAGALVSKVTISIEAYHNRTGKSHAEMAEDVTRSIHHRPIGVMAVFGPYNFPMHLPNGHIVPAILAGNTVVFKPSEETPLCGALLVQYMIEAGIPEGVVQLVQGARDVGITLTNHPDIDGILFTGSYATGKKIHQNLAGRPEVMLALEMGGNNPLIVHDVEDVTRAAKMVLDSAFITAGQRCTCARRLIVPQGEAGNAVIKAIIDMTQRIIIDEPFATPAPFMGTLINNVQADNVLQAQILLQSLGGRSILESKRLHESLPYLSCGIIDVTTAHDVPDEEVFGPLLQIIRVRDMDEAITQANRTSYGLSAGIISDNKAICAEVYSRLKAGIININRPLTGAASTAPFGGPGRSGNYRPSAYYAADYCAYPVASLSSDVIADGGVVGLRMVLG